MPISWLFWVFTMCFLLYKLLKLVYFIIIWWLTFEKKSFQFWQEIWIQVLVILLQVYIQRLCCSQVQIWFKKWTGNCVSREPFWYSTLRHLRNDAGFNAEFWEMVEWQYFQNGFAVLGCLAWLKYPTINELPFLAFVQADAFGKMT